MWNYIKLHWQGDRTQGTAFWVNVVLVIILVKFSIALLSISNLIQNPVVSTRLWLVASALVIFVLLPWSFIGSLRSTWKHIHLFQDRTTGGWLLVLLTLTLFYCSGQIKLYWPGLTNMARIATLQESESFSAISSDKRLFVSGYLTYGSSQAIIEQLKSSQQIETVELNLSGGHLYEARILSRYLAGNEYNTHVSQTCAMNCLIVFLGGEKRSVEDVAEFSFHHFKGYNNGYRSDWTITREQAKDREYFERRGVAQKATFILYYTQKNDADMQLPLKTLKAFNIVTR